MECTHKGFKAMRLAVGPAVAVAALFLMTACAPIAPHGPRLTMAHLRPLERMADPPASLQLTWTSRSSGNVDIIVLTGDPLEREMLAGVFIVSSFGMIHIEASGPEMAMSCYGNVDEAGGSGMCRNIENERYAFEW